MREEMPPRHSTSDATRRHAETVLPRRVKSEELFAGACEVVIVHGGAEYRLRLTRTDKLILTK
jgi:hemin uptake protein HemP